MTDISQLFIVGSPRSGTTLLQSLLAAHSQLLGFTESHFFDKGFHVDWRDQVSVRPELLRQRIRDFVGQNESVNHDDGEQLLSRIHDNPDVSVRALLDFFDALAHRFAKKGWVEKTPDNVFRMSLLRRVSSEMKFVHIIRRPGDTILSLRQAKAKWGSSNAWYRCFGHWYFAMRVTARERNASNHTWLSYEDLTEEPEATLCSLLEWLGFSWEEGLMDRRVDTARDVVRPDEEWKLNNFGAIKARPPKSTSEIPLWLRLVLKRVKIYDRLRSQSPHRIART